MFAIQILTVLIKIPNIVVDDANDGRDGEGFRSDLEIRPQRFLLRGPAATDGLLLRHLLPHLQRTSQTRKRVQVQQRGLKLIWIGF